MLGYFNTNQKKKKELKNTKEDNFFLSFAVELNQKRSIKLSYLFNE
jgi:hypothetical protein